MARKLLVMAKEIAPVVTAMIVFIGKVQAIVLAVVCQKEVAIVRRKTI